MKEADAAAPVAGRYYVLGLLTLIYALNFLDRTIFNVLIEPIKREFGASDTTMGLLAGFGFVLFYSLLGMPIARLADRFNRRNIVALGFAFWSAMTGLCGLAPNLAVLALARTGVGIGEAAGTPASQSIVADLFPRQERPRALGIYAVGTYCGVFLGYFFGGWVSHFYGWRVAFLAAGLPGIFIAILLRLTVREPGRRGDGAKATESWRATFAFLFAQKSYLPVVIGFCLTSYLNYATSAWIPPFLARVYHLTTAEIGTYAGTFKGLFGIAGTLLGGVITTRIGARDERWVLWAPAIASALAGPVLALCLLTDNFSVMLASLGMMSLLVGIHLGPVFAVAQSVAKPAMRALAAATLLLTATCFGQGVGPLLVGVLNDHFAGRFGAAAVRYSLLTASVATVAGAALFVVAALFIRADLVRAEGGGSMG